MTPMKPMFFKLDNIKVDVYALHPDSNRFGPGFGRVIGTGGNGKIIVEGYLYKGKLVFSSQDALGHELIHLLNEKYPELVWNPDKIGED